MLHDESLEEVGVEDGGCGAEGEGDCERDYEEEVCLEDSEVEALPADSPASGVCDDQLGKNCFLLQSFQAQRVAHVVYQRCGRSAGAP